MFIMNCNDFEWFFRASLERLQVEQIGIGQLHWSTANYAPPQELALWDGLVAMYEQVTITYYQRGNLNMRVDLQEPVQDCS